MSLPVPSTTIYLCSGVNFDDDYKNTLYFASRSAQSTFFDSKVDFTLTSYTYQRYKLGVIKVGKRIDDLMNCNYLFFNNSAHEDKRFYCFITSLEYINENTTAVYYSIDVIQTYMFDWTLKQSFVDRQHQPSGENVGDNIIEENLNLGDYILGNCEDLNFDDLYLMIQTDIHISNTGGFYAIDLTTTPTATEHNGLTDGTCITVCRYNGFAPQVHDLGDLTKNYAPHIINMWFYPKNFINAVFASESACYTENFTVVQSLQTALTRPQTLNGYSPRNKKLLTYPYCFLQVSNNNGQTMDLKFERWTSTNQSFLCMGTSTGEAKVLITPQHYNNEPTNFKQTEIGIMSASYPTMSYIGDSYSIYLAQNRNTLVNNMDIIQRNYNFANDQIGVNTLLGALGNVASGNVLGGVGTVTNAVMSSEANLINYENQVSSAVASLEDMKTRPNTVSGIQSIGVNIQNGKNGFTQYIKTVDYQHARIIDDYFTMYGYSQKRVMIPNINARSKYTYVKTVGLNITGDFPSDEKNKIVKIFDNGITFWKENDNIGNYSISNS